MDRQYRFKLKIDNYVGKKVVLFGSEDLIRAQARKVIDDFGPVGNGGHGFNLGHGINQFTPPEAVSILVDEVHSYSRCKH